MHKGEIRENPKRHESSINNFWDSIGRLREDLLQALPLRGILELVVLASEL